MGHEQNEYLRMVNERLKAQLDYMRGQCQHVVQRNVEKEKKLRANDEEIKRLQTATRELGAILNAARERESEYRQEVGRLKADVENLCAENQRLRERFSYILDNADFDEELYKDLWVKNQLERGKNENE